MKDMIVEKLQQGKIAIYGNEENSERFAEELHAVFSHVIHLTDFTEEMELQPFSKYGMETVWFDDYEPDQLPYIVITGQFVRSQNKLKRLRLKEYADYASIYIVRAALQHKKLVVVMGTGAMSQLTAALKACPDFCDDYTVKYYNDKNFFRGAIRKYQEYQHVAKAADVYIHSVQSDVTYRRNIIRPNQFRERCISIGISGNDFNGLHPNLDPGNDLSKYCFRKKEMSRIPYQYYVFAPVDLMMEDFIRRNLSKEDIIASFQSPDLFQAEQIDRNFAEAMAQIRESDQLADIPLAEEILRWKSEVIVSRSLEEWHPKLIHYMVRRIFDLLGHEEKHDCYDRIAEQACQWSGNEIPVCPCVLKHFGLDGSLPDRTYRIVSFQKIRYMTTEEYAAYFADYCIQAGDLYNLIHFERDEMITNVLDYLEKSAYQCGRKIAFSDEKDFIRYNQLRDSARRIGSHFVKALAVRNRPIAVLMRKSACSVAGFFGVVYSGNFYCPIDEAMPKARMKKILDILKPAAILTDDENQATAEELGFPVVAYDQAVEAEDNVRALDEIRASSLDTDPLYVLFTSGSTGFPKGVLVSHRSVIDSTEWIRNTLQITDRDVIGNQSPFYFDNSTFDIYTGIRNGCTIHIIPKELFGFPVKLLAYMEAKKITTICWVPSALCLVANVRALASWSSEHLKNVFFCGEVMPNKQLNQWRKALPDAVFGNLYGMTEITMNCTYYIVDRPFADDEPLPIGSPCRNTEILLLKEDNEPAGDGETGEICVKGSGLAYGYYGNREQTQKAFVQNPLNPRYPEIIYRTGDLGRWNERGELMFAGRKDYQIKHKGHRVELGEIETTAGKIDGIAASACIYDEKKSRIVMLYSGRQLLKKKIKEQLEEQLPGYMVPDKIIWQEDLPHNANGKIDRKQMKEDYDRGAYQKS